MYRGHSAPAKVSSTPIVKVAHHFHSLITIDGKQPTSFDVLCQFTNLAEGKRQLASHAKRSMADKIKWHNALSLIPTEALPILPFSFYEKIGKALVVFGNEYFMANHALVYANAEETMIELLKLEQQSGIFSTYTVVSPVRVFKIQECATQNAEGDVGKTTDTTETVTDNAAKSRSTGPIIPHIMGHSMHPATFSPSVVAELAAAVDKRRKSLNESAILSTPSGWEEDAIPETKVEIINATPTPCPTTVDSIVEKEDAKVQTPVAIEDIGVPENGTKNDVVPSEISKMPVDNADSKPKANLTSAEDTYTDEEFRVLMLEHCPTLESSASSSVDTSSTDSESTTADDSDFEEDELRDHDDCADEHSSRRKFDMPPKGSIGTTRSDEVSEEYAVNVPLYPFSSSQWGGFTEALSGTEVSAEEPWNSMYSSYESTDTVEHRNYETEDEDGSEIEETSNAIVSQVPDAFDALKAYCEQEEFSLYQNKSYCDSQPKTVIQ